MNKTITWIIVTDGNHARTYINDGVGHGIRPVENGEFESPSLPNRDLVSDRPGRTFDRSGKARHAMEPPTDPHRQATVNFIGSVATFLEKANNAGRFDRLVIAAPPRALGVLREKLAPAVKRKIGAELAKDLVKIPLRDLPEHIAKVLAI
jgi:protein required for attachment to host cells